MLLSRPELRAHDRAIRAPITEAVAELRELLTGRLVAYIAGVTETRAVNEWADGTRSIRNPDTEARLRLALQIAVMLAEADEARVVQAWFMGLNPQLDDRSPARLLRDGELDEVGPAVLGAARAFLAAG
jgi:hypothetical protein